MITFFTNIAGFEHQLRETMMDKSTAKNETVGCTKSFGFIELKPNFISAADYLICNPNRVVAFPTPNFEWWLPENTSSEVFEIVAPAYQAGRLLGEALLMRDFPEEIVATVISSALAFQVMGASHQCLLQFVIIKSDTLRFADNAIFSLHRDYDRNYPSMMITRLVQVISGAPTIWCQKEGEKASLFTLPFPHAVIFNSNFECGPLHSSPPMDYIRILFIGTLFSRRCY